jgi:adenine phosphoribosyltransferase
VTTPEDLKKYVRDVPDYPQKGIVFRDITPLLLDAASLDFAVSSIAAWARPLHVDLVLAAEARGFILGAAVARELGVGFVPARKAGKLPWDTVSAMAVKLGAGFVPIRKTGKLPWMTVAESYELEYGTDQLEVHSDAVQPGQKVLIVDDVLATGGTASAAVRLMRKLGADVVGVQVLIELGYLDGRRRLTDVKLVSEIVY